ncbi:CHRD domain-containing protein [Mesonia sp.]|uniref:CHRD domain-containing protein n=1 Tax=Mesonia sp. TaxID=1960830 RepID=UPI003F9A3B3D
MNTRILASLLVTFLFFTSCSNDDDNGIMTPDVGDSKSYTLMSVSNEAISGMVTFKKNSNNTTTVEVDLGGTTSGMHPAHIHMNTAAESGDIAISLEPINGSTGMSSTTFSTKDDGTPISYEQLLDFSGYVNVHKSADDLGTLIAQGDIGQNELTSDFKTFPLDSRSNPNIMGDAKFTKRVNGTTLIEVMLSGTSANGEHPGHIHFNTAAEGGDIAITFTPLNGETGVSKTQVAMLDDGTAITYEELLDFNGYVNIHKSADDLGTLIAQGDIGQNELTGNSKFFTLDSRSNPNIMGDARFLERVNGTTLIKVMLEGTSANGEHPGHIHMNTAAEGGDIAITFTPLNGETGVSKTQVAMLDDGTAITYDELLNYDGYVNIHKSADDLGTLIAQGDIGQNQLTGDAMAYTLGTVDNSGVNGEATFYKRVNGEALLVIETMGTMAGDSHPSHIHMGDINNPGDIVVSLNPVEGESGMSKTNIAMQDGGSTFGYEDALTYNGYINVHLSATELGTLLAQGNIGSN